MTEHFSPSRRSIWTVRMDDFVCKLLEIERELHRLSRQNRELDTDDCSDYIERSKNKSSRRERDSCIYIRMMSNFFEACSRAAIKFTGSSAVAPEFLSLIYIMSSSSSYYLFSWSKPKTFWWFCPLLLPHPSFVAAAGAIKRRRDQRI